MASNRVATPPPLHDLPTAKEKKYDRQLRLWGASGQAALEETHILLVNNGSGVTGIEALKNLVLPGIGQFSILDPAIVTQADLGVNFFLEDESLGKFRAEETVRLLEELNPDAKGTAINEVSEKLPCASVQCRVLTHSTASRDIPGKRQGLHSLHTHPRRRAHPTHQPCPNPEARLRSDHSSILPSLGRVLRPLLRPASFSFPNRRHTS
jgi:hypothetical protein